MRTKVVALSAFPRSQPSTTVRPWMEGGRHAAPILLHWLSPTPVHRLLCPGCGTLCLCSPTQNCISTLPLITAHGDHTFLHHPHQHRRKQCPSSLRLACQLAAGFCRCFIGPSARLCGVKLPPPNPAKTQQPCKGSRGFCHSTALRTGQPRAANSPYLTFSSR